MPNGSSVQIAKVVRKDFPRNLPIRGGLSCRTQMPSNARCEHCTSKSGLRKDPGRGGRQVRGDVIGRRVRPSLGVA